jgi:cytochrome c oxidase assembly protein subunit 15
MSLFRSVNLLALVLCFGVVVFGAYVRLSDAGLGCPDWPGCYGQLTVPEAGHEVASAQARFPQRPVEARKAWKEMTHRYLASTLGLLILFLALYARTGRVPYAPRGLTLALVALVIFQGVLGMWTVTWQLKPLAVSGHLLGGMTTLALLLWTWLSTGRNQRLDDPRPQREKQMRSERHAYFDITRDEIQRPPLPDAPAGTRWFALLLLILLAGQIFLGGWTSSNYAALACPDFPTCQAQWWPDTDAGEAFKLWRGLSQSYEHGVLDSRARVTIHLFHRVGALVVATTALLLGLYLLRRGAVAMWRRFGGALVAVVSLQLALGISIVLLQLPLVLAAGHNAGAALLLLTVVALNFCAWHPAEE